MKFLYFYLLGTTLCEIVLDIIYYILTGRHKLLAISIGIIHLIVAILVYLYDKFSNKDEQEVNMTEQEIEKLKQQNKKMKDFLFIIKHWIDVELSVNYLMGEMDNFVLSKMDTFQKFQTETEKIISEICDND